MGLPVDRLIVATNSNDILHRYFSAGDYSSSGVSETITPSWHAGRIGAMCSIALEPGSKRIVPPRARQNMLSTLPVARVQARRPEKSTSDWPVS